MPFRPAQCSEAVDIVITSAATRYNLPRWWLYVLAHRESSFDPAAFNSANGGEGLMQLTGIHHNGKPYPHDLAVPDDTHQQWIWDMGKNIYGNWIIMDDVSSLSDGFDATENTDRFATVHAVPGFGLMKQKYPTVTDNNDLLRRLAYHWRRGIFVDFDTNHEYLTLYDQYVTDYKGPVEADDGVWNGQPQYEGAAPPPAAATSWVFAQVFNTRVFNAEVFSEAAPPPAKLSVRTNKFNITAPVEAPLPAPHFPSNKTLEVLVQVRNQEMELLAEVRNYTSLTWRRTFQHGGSFRLIVPGKIDGKPNPLIPHLAIHNYVRVHIRQEGENAFQNLVLGGEFQGVIAHTNATLSTNQDTFEVRGSCVLGKRLVIPPFGESHLNKTGPAETIMHSFVFDSASAVSDDFARNIPRLSLGTNKGRHAGVNITKRVRYVPLMDVLAEIAQEAVLGWEVVPWSDGLQFRTFEGIDRSLGNAAGNEPVVFSPEHLNVEGMEYERSILHRDTFAYVGGQGEGVFREVVPAVYPPLSLTPAGLDRKETFIDARDIEPGQLDVLEARGSAKLGEQGPEERLEAIILSTGPYKYRTHWDLGDIVTIQNLIWAVAISLRIMEIEVNVERLRNPLIRVVFGSPIPNRFAFVERKLSQIDTEIRR